MKTVSPKTLDEQREDRMRRAISERHLYTIHLHQIQVRAKSGRVTTETVANVRRKYAAGRDGMLFSYTVTRFGCNCPDAVRARAAGIVRNCKHQNMLTLFLSQNTPEDPEPYVTEEERAEETLAERRALIRKRMENDFPAD